MKLSNYSRIPITLVTLVFLAACQTVGLPLDAQFPAVPQDIIATSNLELSVIPKRDLSAHETEVLWKNDRYVCVATKRALKRLTIRDTKLSATK